MDTCHCTFVQTHRIYNTRENPSVNYGPWVIMTCAVGSSVITHELLWYRMLLTGKAEGAGVGGVQEIPVLSVPFAVNIKLL